MGSHLRRFILAVLLFAVAGWLYSLWRERQGGYGLIDLIKGRPPADASTEGTSTLPEVKPVLKEGDLPGLTQLDSEYAKLAAVVLPSVVSINTESAVATRPRNVAEWMRGYGVARQRGLGSGAIVSKEGHVLTNYHVIAGAQQIQITTDEHKTFSAELIGVDQAQDLALVRIVSNRSDFPALSFADSDEVKVGQIVFAVGNPLGFSGTVSQGIISATQRWTQDSGMEFLQTDANIIPGNSGGPLVNLRGQIVGINESIYTGPQGQQQHAWQGIGLAIPANDAKESLEAMMQHRARPMSFLGIQLEPSPLQVTSPEGAITGVMVTYVSPSTPAQVAGLRQGDVVTKFGGRRVETANQLLTFIKRARPGQPVEMELVREGAMVKVSVVPQPRPQEPRS